MCGVIGLVHERPRADLGRIAAELLQTLEYRGYDSTGAAIQGEAEDVQLLKGVGAPSVMVHELGIVDLAGQILCGQVRWATFGAVDEINAQPHVVRCKTFLYGAHNGNVTNSDALKQWLVDEGHTVLSDNDGEIVVHAVEHYFALGLGELGPDEGRADPDARRRVMRAAIATASGKLVGSFAAVVVDPVTRTVWAIKRGSSLYCGIGQDAAGGRFGLASSDLSSVLKRTRVVVPLVEGELVELTGGAFQVHRLTVEDGRRVALPVQREPVRSRLRTADIALLPPYETFMDQEIAAQQDTVRDVARLFLGGSATLQQLEGVFERRPEPELAELAGEVQRLREQVDDDALRSAFRGLVDGPACRALLAALPPQLRAELQTEGCAAAHLTSGESGFLLDLAQMARDAADRLAVRLFDALLERHEVAEFTDATERFVAFALQALDRGGRLFVTCCGTSLHAAKAASIFFNEIARVDLTALLPGELRGQLSKSLRDGDLLVAVSQSGETKDLIDVLNDVIATGLDIRRVALVNNLNSTLAQEKSEVVVPLACGPEIAVPATKSFMNQLAVFYGLAVRLAEARAARLDGPAGERLRAEAASCWQRLAQVPALLAATRERADAEIETAAGLMYLRPSIHVLATRIAAVAREGALKIREVVLNHAEGFEGSEFKHGPNTILGVSTLYGPAEVQRLLATLGHDLDRLLARAAEADLGPDAMRRLVTAATEAVFAPEPSFALAPEEQRLLDETLDRQALLRSLYADYPLVYITGPDERDVALTISQINTHKIRGATTVVIAEEHPALRAAAARPPADNPDYRHVYITLPRTDDPLMAMFSATLVLQRLALHMSTLKARYLDRIGLDGHGVHPDVPKNVSKSITVD